MNSGRRRPPIRSSYKRKLQRARSSLQFAAQRANRQFIDLRSEATLEYTFTLKYQLRDGDESVDDVVERLGATSRSDALVGIGQFSHLRLDFTREATSAEAALFSALSDVKHAVPSAKLLETTLAAHS